MFKTHDEMVRQAMERNAKLYGDIAKMSKRVLAGNNSKKVKK